MADILVVAEVVEGKLKKTTHSAITFARDAAKALGCGFSILAMGQGLDAVAKELSTSTRTDGITQVLYGGHALYTYAQDAAPGQTTGQGLTQQGGTWWVVGIDGNPIKNSAAATTASS